MGEKKLLICLYANPILHLDFKFVSESEFQNRVENPIVIFEKEEILTETYGNTKN